MKNRFIWLLLLALPAVAYSDEPLLIVEFEGRVTSNYLSCERVTLSCPTANHFGAPWGKDSMVGEPMFDRVQGKLTVAYTRGQGSFNETHSSQTYEIRTDNYGPVNVVAGSISVGGTSFNIDRDYKGLITGGLKWRRFLDIFYISEPINWRRADFSLSSNTYSGHEYYGIVNERRTLLRKFAATTIVNLKLAVFDLPPREGFFGPLKSDALPDWQWDSSQSSRFSAPSQILLNDFEAKHSKESGRMSVSYQTSVSFTLDRINVTSVNSRFTGPAPINAGPGESEGVPGPPLLFPPK